MRLPIWLLLGLPHLFAQTPDSGPALEWRNLEGEVRVMPLDQTPGDALEGLFGTWMQPVGLAPLESEAGPDRADLSLLGGDHLLGRIEGGDAESLRVICPGPTRLSLPVDALRSVVFPARRTGSGALQAPDAGDRLYRRVGDAMDRIDGVLVGFSDQGIELETSLGSRVFAWGEVVALFIEALDTPDAEPSGAGPQVLLDLTCGSRLHGTLASIQTQGILLERQGDRWLIPHAWIRELTVLDGSFRYLSWLTPVDSGDLRSPFDPPGSPPLGMVWPHRVDRTVNGDLLTVGGRVWTHGLGVHAPSRLRWKLDGSDCWLRLAAALDDSALRSERSGSVLFQVLVDDKEVWSSGIRRGGQPAISPDPIDLRGATRLELVVTDGGDGPVLDRAAWLGPILVRCQGGGGR
ncbi:MAG: NPCBM/NEW2 domain-containing protein [Planctomycetes bacterium]|nr:NPCBM/NEW2 domain-containing protein [Planctomycetota bacterium]MCB9909464.1 NPCBM/NEW2 domain-containing protein [Planctomycetota bacterium]